MIKRNQFKYKDMKKACSFYLSDNHFDMTVLSYLKDKIQKGSKVMLFVKENTRDRLYNTITNMGWNISNETWQRNVVIYPLESVKKISEARYLAQNIKSMIDIMSLNCSEEGLILCIQRVNDIEERYISKLEGLIANVSVPVNLINCYEFSSEKEIVLKALANHSFILNTSGLSKIEKVYPGINIKVLA